MNRAFLLRLLLMSCAACVRSRPSEQDAGPAPSASLAPQATTRSTSTAFTVSHCESLLIDAERKLSNERSRAATACKTDDDCKLVETSACIPACSDRAMSKTAVDGYLKAREQVRTTSCTLWNAAECPRITPKPAPECPPMKAVCKTGHCDAVPK